MSSCVCFEEFDLRNEFGRIIPPGLSTYFNPKSIRRADNQANREVIPFCQIHAHQTTGSRCATPETCRHSYISSWRVKGSTPTHCHTLLYDTYRFTCPSSSRLICLDTDTFLFASFPLLDHLVILTRDTLWNNNNHLCRLSHVSYAHSTYSNIWTNKLFEYQDILRTSLEL